jgi:hypothetical protein
MAYEPQDTSSGSARAGNGRERARDRRAEIDIERLADKVYRLMLSEIRLAGARGGRLPRHGKG